MEPKDIHGFRKSTRKNPLAFAMIRTEMGRIIAGQEKLIDRCFWP